MEYTADKSNPEIVDKVRREIVSETLVYDLADFFKVFGDSTRLKILSALDISEMCVCDISDALGMTMSAVSHQLKALREANLVKPRRDGKSIYYSLCDDHVKIILEMATEHLMEGDV